MGKEEMKNKISMALKDTILQIGFEIICKNLSELEKENADLKAYNEKLLNGDIEKHNKIAELEAQIEKMKCCFNCKHSRTEYEHCRTDKHEKWEIKEND